MRCGGGVVVVARETALVIDRRSNRCSDTRVGRGSDRRAWARGGSWKRSLISASLPPASSLLARILRPRDRRCLALPGNMPKADISHVSSNFDAEISGYVKSSAAPLLVTFLANADPAAKVYAKMTRHTCSDGVRFELREVDKFELEEKVIAANTDPQVHGILIYYPVLTASVDDYLRGVISYEKGVEGLNHRYRYALYHNIRHLDDGATKMRAAVRRSPSSKSSRASARTTAASPSASSLAAPRSSFTIGARSSAGRWARCSQTTARASTRSTSAIRSSTQRAASPARSGWRRPRSPRRRPLAIDDRHLGRSRQELLDQGGEPAHGRALRQLFAILQFWRGHGGARRAIRARDRQGDDCDARAESGAPPRQLPRERDAAGQLYDRQLAWQEGGAVHDVEVRRDGCGGACGWRGIGAGSGATPVSWLGATWRRM